MGRFGERKITMFKNVSEPTPEQCDNMELIGESEYYDYYAIWYVQMGGYAGKAIAEIGKQKGNDCIDVLVWHDGNFPFSDGENPRVIHHCDSEQFIRFGEKLKALSAKYGN
jgi:hypothetical protein